MAGGLYEKKAWMLRSLLEHPLTRGLDIDDPHTTDLRKQIIEEKPFLKQIYHEWYGLLAATIPISKEPVLEIGSGAGFASAYIPNLITSEFFFCNGIRAVMDGQRLPIVSNSLRGITLTDVLHHIPQPRLFLAEATRCVRAGGVVVMIEPWVTAWSKLIFSTLHHEPILPTEPLWELPSTGPLSGANIALPWMILERDRSQFESEFPMWQIEIIRPMMPFRYLVSGGVALRSLMPKWTTGLWKGIETILAPWMNFWGMFAFIVLRRKSD